MKSTTRISILMSVMLVLGMVASLCGGLAGGILIDRSLLNRPTAVALAPTPVIPIAPTVPPPTVAPTQAPTGTTPATVSPTPAAPPQISGEGLDLNLIAEARKLIQEHYVDRNAIKDQTLTYGAISGMVNALGDTGHTRFLSPEDVKIENNSLKGEFEGIGVYVEARNGQVYVVTPIDGSPAQKQGIRPGDIIEKVDGEDIGGLPLDQVVSRIIGAAGTDVTLTILTPSTNQEREVTITRAKIVIKIVTWQALPGTTIAHLRLSTFSQGATEDLKKAISEIQQQNMTAIVFDLRNNPGGLVNEAIGVASQFLATGVVFQEKDSTGKVINIPVKKGGTATKIPMVVLVNRGSASAAEIVAGAIQDAKRGMIVGDTTFGTGTVLSQFPLSDGSALFIAVQEWLTPSGRVIWHTGIVPDQAVKLDLNVSPLTPESERNFSAADITNSKDAQLLKAIDLLKNP